MGKIRTYEAFESKKLRSEKYGLGNLRAVQAGFGAGTL